jgi:hypothetical protein
LIPFRILKAIRESALIGPNVRRVDDDGCS